MKYTLLFLFVCSCIVGFSQSKNNEIGIGLGKVYYSNDNSNIGLLNNMEVQSVLFNGPITSSIGRARKSGITQTPIIYFTKKIKNHLFLRVNYSFTHQLDRSRYFYYTSVVDTFSTYLL
jgi:hypothetical protein